MNELKEQIAAVREAVTKALTEAGEEVESAKGYLKAAQEHRTAVATEAAGMGFEIPEIAALLKLSPSTVGNMLREQKPTMIVLGSPGLPPAEVEVEDHRTHSDHVVVMGESPIVMGEAEGL